MKKLCLLLLLIAGCDDSKCVGTVNVHHYEDKEHNAECWVAINSISCLRKEAK